MNNMQSMRKDEENRKNAIISCTVTVPQLVGFFEPKKFGFFF